MQPTEILPQQTKVSTQAKPERNGSAPQRADLHTFSFFPKLAQPKGQQEKLTRAEFLERLATCDIRRQKDGPLISGAIYPADNVHRSVDNVEAVSAFNVDLDETFTFNELCERVESLGVLAVLYSTHSHGTPDTKNHPNAHAPGERYRVCFLLDKPLSATDYPDAWERLNIFFKGELDAACKDASRAFFLPSHPTGENFVFRVFNEDGPCLSLNQLPALPVNFNEPQEYAIPATGNGSGRPGDDFTAQATNETTAQILESHGWTVTRSESCRWKARRPGKRGPGASATIGHHAPGQLHNFSSNALPFEENRDYPAFRVYSLLEHDGDFTAAARELGQQGFGNQTRRDQFKLTARNGTEPQRDGLQVPAGDEPRPNPFVTNRRTLTEIFERPRPLWSIEGFLLEFGYSAFTGGYGSFKSFIVLDMLLRIATGTEWHGRKVKQGTVVYVVAEGAYTTADRVKAWLIRHQMEAPENFYVIEIPAQIGDPFVCAQFIEAIVELNPVFVAFDTLAKCNVGADENSSRDMGLFTHGMQEVATQLRCQVMAVHHNNKNGDSRGSNSLPSNVDTHITAKASEGRIITIECEKTKVAPFQKFSLIGRIVELGERDEYENEVTSLVFEPTDTPEKTIATTANERKCLEVLPDHGATSEEWWQLASETEISKSTFYRCRDSLKGKLVHFDSRDGLYRPQSQSPTQSQRNSLGLHKQESQSPTTRRGGTLGLSAGTDTALPEMPPAAAQQTRKSANEPYSADDSEVLE